MRQRRSAVRSETTAASLMSANLASRRAAIYPFLAAESAPAPSPRLDGARLPLHPGLVCRRAIDRGHLTIGHAQVHGQLTAMVHAVHEHEPQDVHAPYVAHLLGRDEELHRLVQLGLGRLPDALGERRVRLLVGGD